MGVLCKQHNLAVERAIERRRETRRAEFIETYKANVEVARQKPLSDKEKLKRDFLFEPKNKNSFWLYPNVDEVQLGLLAEEHFADNAEDVVKACADLVKWSLKKSSFLVVSTSKTNLKTCMHRKTFEHSNKWVANVYLRTNKFRDKYRVIVTEPYPKGQYIERQILCDRQLRRL